MSITKEERLRKIISITRDNTNISTRALSEQLGISYPTICRDVKELEKKGLIDHYHGGIRLHSDDINSLTSHPQAIADYYMYEVRKSLNYTEKRVIAQAAANLIKTNDIIFLTHGTTTCELAYAINKSTPLTIITDGLDVMNAFRNHPNVHLYALGGNMNYKSMQIEHTPYISCDISHINLSKIIIGIGGISENGLAFYDYNSFSFIKQILKKNSDLIVLADSSKFDSVALANFIPLENITTLITDCNISQAHINDLERWGVPYILAS